MRMIESGRLREGWGREREREKERESERERNVLRTDGGTEAGREGGRCEKEEKRAFRKAKGDEQ